MIYLATCRALSELDLDDQLLIPAFAARGVEARAVVWDDVAIDWDAADLVVIRSCWDYIRRVDYFMDWADALAETGVRLMNPAATVRWNAHKRYLDELRQAAVPTPTMVWFDPAHTEQSWRRALEDARLPEQVVYKPAVSVGGYNTWRGARERTDLDVPRLRLLAEQGHEMFAQPFMEEIMSDGEWSLIFFGGAFSHAARKTAATGEFRIHEEYGGVTARVEAPERLVAQAQRVLEQVPEHLYARVDGVVRRGVLVVMEVELIEPSLYFHTDDASAGRFVDAALGMLEPT